jgi:putative FmdB family regulatory protein
MPLYEYMCHACRARFERLRPMGEADRETPCPRCGPGSRVRRVLSLVAAPARGNDFASDPRMGGGSCACGGGGCGCRGH